METVARVLAVGGGTLRLACQAQSPCGSCGAGRACGSRLFQHQRGVPLDLPCLPGQGDPPVPGDLVTLVVPDDDIARAAAITYLPLVVGLLAGAALAGSAGNFGDGIAGLGALLGGAAGWAIGRTVSRQLRPRIRIVRDAGCGVCE